MPPARSFVLLFLSLSLDPPHPHTHTEYRRAQVKEGTVANTYPQLAVKGTGFDRTLGGLQIELRLRDHLAAIFEVQY